MKWARLVPAWAWWLLVLLLVGGGQQLRVNALQVDLQDAQEKQQDVSDKLTACRETRSTLLAQVSEQNAAVADLRSQADARAQQAAQAQAGAREQAQVEYQAANRLQQERIGGDVCAAATRVIDQDLGL